MLSHCPSEGRAALAAAASVWCFRKCLSALSNTSCADAFKYYVIRFSTFLDPRVIKIITNLDPQPLN